MPTPSSENTPEPKPECATPPSPETVEQNEVAAEADEILDEVFAEPDQAAKELEKTAGFVPETPTEQSIAHKDGEDGRTGLVPCPACDTRLEPWQVTCHLCGETLLHDPIPVVVAADPLQSSVDLKSSYSDWLNRGVEALEKQMYGEAQACFLEALTRVRGMDKAVSKEIEVRKHLAVSLERQDKRAEATEQYLILSTLSRRAHDQFEALARKLSMSTMDLMARIDKTADFKPPDRGEIKLVPLYCGFCKQLLVEAEVYGFRNAKSSRVRCFCGYEGPPLVRRDAKHIRALRDAPVMRSHKSKLIQAASDVVSDGRKSGTAILLAVLLGGVGAHRFYLGERAYGLAYLALCWTGIPWIVAIFEAINYSQMSRVTFNLMYNIESIISRLPTDDTEEPQGHSEVFSMEITEDPEDFIDEFSAVRRG
jgi:TM2 domain-containing membrane protein YozV